MNGLAPRSDLPYEAEGFWWDPNDDRTAQPAYGRLRHDPDDGVVLEVREWREDATQHPTVNVRCLHGLTLEGTPCTVFHPIRVHEQFKLGRQPVTSVWRASEIAIGDWIDDRNELLMETVSVSFRGLFEWLTTPVPGLSAPRVVGANEEDQVQLDLADATVTLKFESYVRETRTERVERREPKITIQASSPKTLAEFDAAYLRPLRDLVLFATTEATATQALTLIGLDESGPSSTGDGRREIHLLRQDANRSLPSRQSSYRHLLMPFAAWNDTPERTLRAWFAFHTKLGPAAGLLFATLDSQPRYLENWFLNLAGFAEVYHRTMLDDPPVTPDEHAAAVGEMLAAIDDPRLRAHYEARLSHAHEQGFRSRLKQLFRRAEKTAPEIARWRSGGLIDRIYETRNGLVHRAKAGDNGLEDTALHVATRRLLAVLQINIMIDLGLSDAAQAACVALRYRNSIDLFETPPTPSN